MRDCVREYGDNILTYKGVKGVFSWKEGDSCWCGNGEEGSGGVGYDKITTENMLICRYEEGRLLKREEVNWQDQLCEEWADFTTQGESIYYQGSMAKEDMVLFAKRVLELSGELK